MNKINLNYESDEYLGVILCLNFGSKEFHLQEKQYRV